MIKLFLHRPASVHTLLLAGAAGALALSALNSPAASVPDRVDFNHHIRPLLSDRCFFCHGPDEKGRKGKLRLDTPEGAFKALDGGISVIKPGDPAKSEIIRRITSTDPDEMMPPPKSHLSLAAEEVALLKRWVQQGAEWKKHWAFLPIEDTPLPSVKNTKWPRNEIDRFILARLEREKLKPSADADKERLLRRATFDLTGIPPTLAEIEAFLADKSTDAYEKVVDRLLASPAYGERMAVDWLDVARYADTYGYQSDRFNHLWPWRDWVISAFNRNVRINDFILWQIAGDLLPDATREQKMATAFNRLHRQTNEGGSVDEEFRVEYNADRVHTASAAFLGLTMECARCHDHKYDPITQKDYYRLFAFFNSTDESGLYSHFTDAIPSPTTLLFKDDAEETKHREMKRAIVAMEQELLARRAAAKNEFEQWRKGFKELPAPAGLVGHYTFDGVTNSSAANTLGTNFPAKLHDKPLSAPGRFGDALKFSGENFVTINKAADFKRTDEFSLSFWINIPEELPELVVLHHQQAGSDAGYQGYQFVLEDGFATFSLVHFWPGNALQIRTAEKLPLHQWLHIGITYDGSSRASGTKLYLNGAHARTEVVRDGLFKEFANGNPLTLAARFRGRGFKDGLIDDLKIFNRALTPVEMARAHGDTTAPSETDLLEYYLARIDLPSLALAAELKKLRNAENDFINRIDEIMSMGDLPKPRPTYVLKRGEYDKRGETVDPGTPESIFPMPGELPRNRLGLARWLIDARNPLTSRVIVNRAWQQFFGRGLVVTAEDFGSQGALPSHPDLLDWLAKHFMDTGWDMKALCKLIVTSSTYRQSAHATPELLARDADNKLLARGPKTRLSAEMLRDQALAASGLLVNKIGGPSVKPYQPDGLWEEKSSGWKYDTAKGDSLYRRGMYTYWKRASQHPMMMTFDAAERNTCSVRRQNTSTPLQALVLLNDTQFVEAARQLAARMLKEGGATTDARITFAFRLLTGRHPTKAELSVLKKLHDEQLALFRADDADASALAKVGESSSDASLDRAELAACTALANTLFNFDEAVFKR
jgi:Protein of unknown function (DUF1553)/Protein of unknown function (DUF1549)/Concanavalin A-like lectin/glucanases superfamily/Planctomycete cytochrome C